MDRPGIGFFLLGLPLLLGRGPSYWRLEISPLQDVLSTCKALALKKAYSLVFLKINNDFTDMLDRTNYVFNRTRSVKREKPIRSATRMDRPGSGGKDFSLFAQIHGKQDVALTSKKNLLLGVTEKLAQHCPRTGACRAEG